MQNFAACLAVAFAAALYRIRTFDTFFHLAAGRLVIEQGSIPATDPFSFTFRDASWINHSFGFQVVIAELHDLGGFAALSVYQAAVATLLAGVGLFALRTEPRRLAGSALLLGLAFSTLREVLEARPHVLGWLALALTLQIASVAQTPGDPRRLFWILPVYAAWTVVHGSHVLAFVVVGTFAGIAFLERGRAARAAGAASGSLARQLLRALPKAWIACLLAVLGLGLWLAPAAFTQGGQHFASEFLETTIPEWAPLRFEDLLVSASGYVYLGCVGLALAGAYLAQRSRQEAPSGTRAVWILLLVFFALSLTSRRMVPLFLFGAAPLWLPFAALAFERLTARLAERVPRQATVALFAIFWVGLFASLASDRTFALGAGLDERRFPVAAAAKIARDGRVHRLYNAYNFGGYLMFAGVPDGGVFVDGRALTVYPSEFLATFDRAYHDLGTFRELASRYRVDGVLMPYGSAKAAGLITHLRSSPEWRLTYEDPIAVLFERK